MIDYDKFSKALQHLQRQLQNYHSAPGRQGLTELDEEALGESVIHRFETCYDCTWKVLKRYLMEELGIPDVPNSPKPILRLASENGLLPSGVEKWLLYADARIDTSHDYSGTKAQDCLRLMDDFVEDTVGLYRAMTGKPWE